MDLIVKALISALFVGALGTVIYVQRASLITAKARAARAEKTISERDASINTLKAADANNRKALIKLQAARQSIAATLSERETMIESLQHENAAIRSWADTALPDAIARMRERSAVTGAHTYRLSGGHALQPAGVSTQD